MDWLVGGGEMAERIRAFPWSKTPLGPPESWSPALRTMLGIMLANRFPHILWWGPHYIQFYNDAYRPIPGSKHPDRVLGQPASECWREIWHVIGPLIDTPFNGGAPTWDEDIFLEVHRHGFVEETHFTIAYSPVPDDAATNGIGGVLATVHEITEKVVGERRGVVLRDLGARVGEAKTAEEACAIAAETLAQHAKDIPFALLYLIDPDGKRARLVGSAGVPADSQAGPPLIELGVDAGDGEPWPLADVIRSETIQVVEALTDRLGTAVPRGPWSDPPRQAAIVPIRSNIAHQLAGILVAGVSTRLKFDEQYGAFYELVASQIATAIANARAYEEERKRAEALAEIDRAKTAFFSNVSHEFRTPLTLMLGPLEDALANSHGILPPGAARDLGASHRNALRLLKLVNAMLDFSRIEAGRVQASYEPTDVGAITAELASNFRSACEKAGLRLVVDSPPLGGSEPAYVDRDMWEKIVLNLVSNAFKFTLEGEIEVRLRAVDGEARLTVRDTGVGIPAAELPRMFERFHRVENGRGRTHEGTGIGLALVQELVKLHGGTVRVASEAGEGSTFTVTIPLGKAHLDPERIGKASELASTAIHSEAFVEEALRWLPETGVEVEAERELPGAPARGERARILWADDNADMREYVSRLLSGRFDVQAVADGQAALEAARAEPPDLVLSDVMMPKLDGFGLLLELRADPRLREIPILLVSARAGEESRIEGLDAGADDYLIKPFSARELVARVETHVRMARLRGEAGAAVRRSERELSDFFENAAVALHWVGPDGVILRVNQAELDMLGYSREEYVGHHVAEFHADPAVIEDSLARLTRGETVREYPARLRRKDGSLRDVRISSSALFEDGQFIHTRCFTRDVTEHTHAQEVRALWGAIVDSSDDAIISKDLNGIITSWNKSAERVFGYTASEAVGRPITMLIPADRLDEEPKILERLKAGERVDHFETVRVRKDGSLLDVSLTISPLKSADGRIAGASKIARDITERKRAEEALRAADRAKDEFLAMLGHELRNPLGALASAVRLLDLEGRSPSEVSRARAVVGRQLDHLTRLVDDLLDVSRVTTSKVRLSRRTLDLTRAAKGALEALRSHGALDSHQVTFEGPPAWVDADETRIEQIVTNLVGNAVKFTPPGGTISVKVERAGRDAVLTVKDTGAGISAEAISRIFDLFVQGEGTLDRSQGGLGIGLTLARRLVELHGGTIRAESDGPGKGSTFTVCLPALDAPASRPSARIPSQPARASSRRVLIVEDNQDAREMLRVLLTIEGHEVHEAVDGPSGLEAALTVRPDIALLDVGLPGLDGYALARSIRARPEGRDIFLVALTGYGQFEDRRRAREAGFDEHVVKPLDLARLTPLLARASQSGRA
jgi:PAS domain S-box-containing protein